MDRHLPPLRVAVEVAVALVGELLEREAAPRERALLAQPLAHEQLLLLEALTHLAEHRRGELVEPGCACEQLLAVTELLLAKLLHKRVVVVGAEHKQLGHVTTRHDRRLTL